MKKLRIELLPTVLNKTYRFFDNTDALLDDLTYGTPASNEYDEAFDVTIRRGEWIEAEWIGCENFFDSDGSLYKMTFVRLCKLSKHDHDTEPTVEPFVGWILDEKMRFVDGIDESCTRTILPSSEWNRVDFAKIFADSERNESEKNTDG